MFSNLICSHPTHKVIESSGKFGGLADIPERCLYAIFNKIDLFQDLLNTGFVCKKFYFTLQPHVYKWLPQPIQFNLKFQGTLCNSSPAVCFMRHVLCYTIEIKKLNEMNAEERVDFYKEKFERSASLIGENMNKVLRGTHNVSWVVDLNTLPPVEKFSFNLQLYNLLKLFEKANKAILADARKYCYKTSDFLIRCTATYKRVCNEGILWVTRHKDPREYSFYLLFLNEKNKLGYPWDSPLMSIELPIFAADQEKVSPLFSDFLNGEQIMLNRVADKSDRFEIKMWKPTD